MVLFRFLIGLRCRPVGLFVLLIVVIRLFWWLIGLRCWPVGLFRLLIGLWCWPICRFIRPIRLLRLIGLWMELIWQVVIIVRCRVLIHRGVGLSGRECEGLIFNWH